MRKVCIICDCILLVLHVFSSTSCIVAGEIEHRNTRVWRQYLLTNNKMGYKGLCEPLGRAHEEEFTVDRAQGHSGMLQKPQFRLCKMYLKLRISVRYFFISKREVRCILSVIVIYGVKIFTSHLNERSHYFILRK